MADSQYDSYGVSVRAERGMTRHELYVLRRAPGPDAVDLVDM